MSKQSAAKMGTEPINKLLISMSVPMIISMLIQALYNIVDSIFVAKISQDALNALSLSFPLQNLMISVGVGTGVGVNAVLSRSLGEKDQKQADRTANVGLFLAVCSYLVFLIFGLTGCRWYFTIQTTEAGIIEAGYEYLSICSVFSLGLFGQTVMEKMLSATGRTSLTMLSQGFGAIVNIILDPILIFGYFGLPAMGVVGAAIATVIGQTMGCILALYFNIRRNKDIHLHIKEIRPDRKTVGMIYGIGVPSIIMTSIGSVMTFGMNQILLSFTKVATAVFGVYFKIQSFIFMPVFGLNNGMVPIIAYNYGAGKRKRVIDTIKLSILYACSIMLIGLAVFQIFPKELLLMFDADEEMLAIGIRAFRIISLSYIVAGYAIVIGSVCQALGKSMYSLLNSLVRQLVVLLPVAYLLSLTGNLDLVWLAFPIAEISSFIISTLALRHVLKVCLPKKEEYI